MKQEFHPMADNKENPLICLQSRISEIEPAWVKKPSDKGVNDLFRKKNRNGPQETKRVKEGQKVL